MREKLSFYLSRMQLLFYYFLYYDRYLSLMSFAIVIHIIL